MTWVATAVLGGSALLNYFGQRNATNQAVDAQTNAANQANQTQWDMYNQNRTDQTPWRDAGGWAVGQMQGALGPGGGLSGNFTMNDFQQDPGYAFRMQQGQQALERSAASRGLGLSGGTLKALNRYGQDYASNEYGNAFNRYMSQNSNRFNQLASLAGLGQTSANVTGQFGANAANQMGQNYMGIGNAQAAGSIAQGNQFGNLLNSGLNAWQYANMMKNPGTSPGSSSYLDFLRG